ncbi:hypothetical protein VHN57_01375 [Sphingobium sp. WW5]|uniref:hypothetical protein n=1 Tax=unclassified Sphingobium TaxID=2611147 RepID=UPI003C25860C
MRQKPPFAEASANGKNVPRSAHARGDSARGAPFSIPALGIEPILNSAVMDRLMDWRSNCPTKYKTFRLLLHQLDSGSASNYKLLILLDKITNSQPSMLSGNLSFV